MPRERRTDHGYAFFEQIAAAIYIELTHVGRHAKQFEAAAMWYRLGRNGISRDLRPIRPPRRFCKARSCGVSGCAQSTGAARPSVSAQGDGRRAEPATALRRIVPRVGAGARPNPGMMAGFSRCTRLSRKGKPWLVESLFPSQPLLWAFRALLPMPQQLASSKLRKTSSLSLT